MSKTMREVREAWLESLRLERGTCSDEHCTDPVAGYCATCKHEGRAAPQWCARHMLFHAQLQPGHEPCLPWSNARRQPGALSRYGEG